MRTTRDIVPAAPAAPRQHLALILACGVLAGCAGGSAPAGDAAAPAEPEAAASPAEAPPAVIVAERGGFIPEGVEYDQRNRRFLTGSLSEGSIFEIQNDGRLVTVVSDPDLVSSVGIEVDELRNRLLVANSDRAVFDGGVTGHAKLGVYDLTSGDRIAMVDLGAVVTDAGDDTAHFANDVAVAEDGTAYVTDTQLNALYRVDTGYEASVLYRFEDGGPGPNGLVHHPSGFLLVARGDTLWNVPVDDPAGAAEVVLPETVPGQDGLVWSAGRLVIVSNSANKVVALTSTDEWATAELAGVATYETQATTGAVVDDDVYVVHAHFADEDPPSLERVVFR